MADTPRPKRSQKRTASSQSYPKGKLDEIRGRLDKLEEGRPAEVRVALNATIRRLDHLEEWLDNRLGGLRDSSICPRCDKKSYAAGDRCEHCGGLKKVAVPGDV